MVEHIDVYTRLSLAAMAVSLYYNVFIDGDFLTGTAINRISDVVFFGGCVIFVIAPFFKI